jgi:hypothetical protein
MTEKTLINWTQKYQSSKCTSWATKTTPKKPATLILIKKLKRNLKTLNPISEISKKKSKTCKKKAAKNSYPTRVINTGLIL